MVSEVHVQGCFKEMNCLHFTIIYCNLTDIDWLCEELILSCDFIDISSNFFQLHGITHYSAIHIHLITFSIQKVGAPTPLILFDSSSKIQVYKIIFKVSNVTVFVCGSWDPKTSVSSSHSGVPENMAQVKSIVSLGRVWPEAKTSTAPSRLYMTLQSSKWTQNGHTLSTQAKTLCVCSVSHQEVDDMCIHT